MAPNATSATLVALSVSTATTHPSAASCMCEPTLETSAALQNTR